MATMIKCPFCGGLADAASDNCIHCGGPLKSRAVQPGAGKTAAVLCPACGAGVGPGDIVCVKCGTNLLTGQKIADEKQKEAKPGRFAFRRVLAYGAFALVVLAAAGALIALVIFLLRDPVGEARRIAASGNLTEAIEVLQVHLQKAPKDEEAQFLLGKICWQGQQYERAAEVFEAVARQGGMRERDALVLALLASERASKSENRPRLLSMMDTAIHQRYSSDAELIKVFALLRGVEGEYKGHRDTMQEALLTGANLAPALPGLSMVLDNALDVAEPTLDKALEAHPGDAGTSVVRAMAHLMRGRETEALPLLEAAADLPPELAGLVKLQAGLIYMRQGENGKALTLLTEGKKLLPEDTRMEFFHALCLQENKLLDEALISFERIANGKSAYAGSAALQMAIIFMEKGVLDRATAMARQAGESGLNTARQATIQGRVFALQNDVGQAEQAYRRAISMMADYPAARLELGLLLINRGSIDAGLQELEYYLELAKKDPQGMRANEIEVLVAQIRQTRQ